VNKYIQLSKKIQ